MKKDDYVKYEKDDYVKIVAVDGRFRYAYIIDVFDKGLSMGVSFFEEGESKIAYDAAHNALLGEEPVDWIALLTDIEKRLVPLLSAGLNSFEIAEKMSISPTTIRAHLRTLRIKLHLDNRAQLVTFSQALEAMIIKRQESNG